MVKRCCAFLSALMIVLFSTFSQYAAISTYAAMDPRYYVAAGPLIASIFTAYGYKRSGTNSALADLVSQCIVDAADAGYTTVRNGVESCGIAIQDGISYCKKDFLDWVYSWCNKHNMSTPQVDGSFEYPSYSVNQAVQFQPYSGDWRTYASSCGFPSNVVSAFEKYSSSLSGRRMYCAAFERTEFTTNTEPSYTFYYLGYSTISAGNYTINNRTHNDSAGYSFSYLYPSGYENSSSSYYVKVMDNGTITSGSSKLAISASIGSSFSYSVDGFYGPGVYGPYTRSYTNYPCTFNAVYSAESAGYEVSDDAPSKTKTFTEYVSNPASWEGLNSWGGKEKNVNIDGTNTTGMPITIPIDIIIDGTQIGAAVADIISGAQAAVDAALAMTQQVAREGTITEAAEGELEEANTAVENTMEVADAQPIVNDILGWGIDYVKPHLSKVFKKYPFSIPYDIYLILNSLYSGANSHRVLKSVKLQDSRASGSVDSMDPNTVGVIVDFDYVSKDSVSENDPNAPNFLYDFNISAFGKTYHFVGILDFAPFGGLIKLGKVCIGFLWILSLLLWNYNDIKGVKKNG
jgi:hypothetical protein